MNENEESKRRTKARARTVFLRGHLAGQMSRVEVNKEDLVGANEVLKDVLAGVNHLKTSKHD